MRRDQRPRDHERTRRDETVGQMLHFSMSIFRSIIVLLPPMDLLASSRMPNTPPPTDALVELAAALGEDNVRELVRTFLRDFPISLRDLAGSDRKQRHRTAHNLKSNSHLMGAYLLSERMAALERRLADETAGNVTPDDLAAINAEYAVIAAPLRAFVGA
ncbi:MAG: hypothetical protein RIQ93_3519 [Verrucomicrobiota bacterium]|jgi:HPt (histidine-containing phosphotransfer) domain-containing protein